MNTISIYYSLVWQVKGLEHYQLTKSGECFNIRTGRKMKQSYCGGSIGMSLGGRFRSLKWIRSQLEKIPVEKYNPF